MKVRLFSASSSVCLIAVAFSLQAFADELNPQSLSDFSFVEVRNNSLSHLQVADGDNVDDLYLYAPDELKETRSATRKDSHAVYKDQIAYTGTYYLIAARDEKLTSYLPLGTMFFVRGSEYGGVEHFIVPGQEDDFVKVAQSTRACVFDHKCVDPIKVEVFSVNDGQLKQRSFLAEGVSYATLINPQMSQDGKTLTQNVINREPVPLSLEPDK